MYLKLFSASFGKPISSNELNDNDVHGSLNSFRRETFPQLSALIRRL